MSTVRRISPMTRVEGHLEVEITVETVNGVQQVIDARSSSSMFRGFELILAGRDPRDAVHYTQRVCGVCPISHAMASCLVLEDAFDVIPTENGRIMRNLVLGANFLQSHILHFYHLAAPDYLNTAGILDMSPWQPRYTSPDLVDGPLAAALVGHYVQALDMRRKAHQLGAIFGGRMPAAVSFVPGGATAQVTAEAVSNSRRLLDELRAFIDTVYLADADALVALFPEYTQVGRGPGNLLAYGVFDLTTDGTAKLLARGRITDNRDSGVDQREVREYVSHSWYSAGSGGRTPAQGVTEPDADQPDGYSWIKAPRYADRVHEVGPLARMWVNGDYRYGVSVMDRIAARALEAKKIADAMNGWLDELQVGGPVYNHSSTPVSAQGVGLTEAPRGALGHWLQIANGRIARYQMITPTGWNASPRDDSGQPGPMEQALIGTPVRSIDEPMEVMRVVHSFDPCLSCSVHMLRPDQDEPAATAVLAGSPI